MLRQGIRREAVLAVVAICAVSDALLIALGLGARPLGRLPARPSSWRVLDGLVATTMITMGTLLITGA